MKNGDKTSVKSNYKFDNLFGPKLSTTNDKSIGSKIPQKQLTSKINNSKATTASSPVKIPPNIKVDKVSDISPVKIKPQSTVAARVVSWFFFSTFLYFLFSS